MKKMSLVCAVITSFYILAGFAAYSQPVAVQKRMSEPVPSLENKSNQGVNSDVPLSRGTLNTKALKTFTAIFGQMQDVIWSNFDRDHDRAYFVNNGITVRAGFNKKGKLIYTIRYYTAEHLPTDILSLVEDAYRCMNIFGIVEVTVIGKTAYFVNLEDKKSWLTVKVLDGEITEESTYQKR